MPDSVASAPSVWLDAFGQWTSLSEGDEPATDTDRVREGAKGSAKGRGEPSAWPRGRSDGTERDVVANDKRTRRCAPCSKSEAGGMGGARAARLSEGGPEMRGAVPMATEAPADRRPPSDTGLAPGVACSAHPPHGPATAGTTAHSATNASSPTDTTATAGGGKSGQSAGGETHVDSGTAAPEGAESEAAGGE